MDMIKHRLNQLISRKSKLIMLGLITFWHPPGGSIFAMEELEPVQPRASSDQSRQVQQERMANDQENISETSLHLAISKGDVEEVKRLIGSGVDVNKRVAHDGSHNPPLYLAVRGNHLQVAKLLIRAGADVNDRLYVSFLTPLAMAVICSQAEVVKLLIASGADLNTVARKLENPLYQALSEGKLEIARLLIEAGANLDSLRVIPAIMNDPDLNGGVHLFVQCMFVHPLMHIILYGDAEQAKNYLVKLKQANIAGNQLIRRALKLAAGQGLSSVVEFIILEFSSCLDTESTVQSVINAATGGHLAILKLLLPILDLDLHQAREQQRAFKNLFLMAAVRGYNGIAKEVWQIISEDYKSKASKRAATRNIILSFL